MKSYDGVTLSIKLYSKRPLFNISLVSLPDVLERTGPKMGEGIVVEYDVEELRIEILVQRN